ncbi:Oidioi.mRNA.OKI2018_I69.PAR.g10826.t1.cds [Oikopleura dioica]|uniref:Oidioi.mRNA.OKI2018_I69.PAR.g10826.t1.cds n=1 Tax=Oikopleura dioica TaxID=34765 RepID=A0ABN7RSM7_OIKDI|nr:Oidioi.mRNA.OKI2018_I69.PAR.g10826.t1.cds [Oikopleura dioica]
MDNLREKLLFFIFERDRKKLVYEVGAVAGLYAVCKVPHFILKYTLLHPIPTYDFPQTRDENFKVLQKGLDEGKLPRIFRPRLFPGSTFSDMFIITDFEIMKEAFAKREISNRQFSEKVVLCIKDTLRRRNYHSVPRSILDENDQLLKNGAGDLAGTAEGPYDHFHKKFRAQWHDTMKRLVGKNRITEIIQSSAENACIQLKRLGSSPSGMDPRRVFMNGSINVTSGFAYGKNYDFEDPEFKQIAEYIDSYFVGIFHYNMKAVCDNMVPLWDTNREKLSHSNLYCELWRKTPVRHMEDAIPLFHAYVFKMIKEQRKLLDPANPRNFLDTLLIDASNDPEWGYFTIACTIVAIFLGASDTLANTMTWLSMVLADHPEVQKKMFEEIKAARSIDTDLKKENCPLTRSILLESRRLNPVTDTLIHIVSEDTKVKGFTFPKNSQILGSLTAVMHDPKNFPEPSKFIPDRFIDENGEFVNNPKVCGFSVGLRNCIGKSLAIEEYFAFATSMVENFEIKRLAGNMDIEAHPFLRIPKDDVRLQFIPRKK